MPAWPIEHEVNVGTIRGRPGCRAAVRAGQVRCRPRSAWWDGGLVVVRARERRVHGEGDQQICIDGDLDDRPGEPAIVRTDHRARTVSRRIWGTNAPTLGARHLLAALLRWRHRGTFLALWHDIARVSTKSVVLRQGFERYSPVLRDEDQRSPGEHQNPS